MTTPLSSNNSPVVANFSKPVGPSKAASATPKAAETNPPQTEAAVTFDVNLNHLTDTKLSSPIFLAQASSAPKVLNDAKIVAALGFVSPPLSPKEKQAIFNTAPNQTGELSADTLAGLQNAVFEA